MITNLLICLRFFSRLPVPATAREGELGSRGLAGAAAMAPVAGVAIGLVPALVVFALTAAGLPSFLTAALAVAALITATGALHEDGLADCADGFGGGATLARKLEIMRDSRIGTFGACALGLSLIIRVGALAEIVARSSAVAALVLVAAAAVSRALCLWPLALLVPARTDGSGVAAGRIEGSTVLFATLIAAVLLVAIGVLSGRPVQALAAGAFSALAAIVCCGLAHRQIGGQTGDVAGCVQQVAEITILLVFATNVPTLLPLAQ